MIGTTNSIIQNGIFDGPLWINPNIAASFAAQTISIDLTAYNAVLIEIEFANGTSNRLYRDFQIVDKDPLGAELYFKSASSATPMGRVAIANDTGVEFKAGYNNTTSNQTVCIPVAIYGIRGFPV